MNIMTASEASRHFSTVLDEAEHGETIIVTRGGRRVATIGPASAANGAALRKLARSWSAPDDPDFATDIRDIRAAVDGGDEDPWATT